MDNKIKTDKQIKNEFKGMKIIKITDYDIELEFPAGGESVGGGGTYICDNYIKYQHNGKIAFENWYPETIYYALVAAIEEFLNSKKELRD